MFKLYKIVDRFNGNYYSTTPCYFNESIIVDYQKVDYIVVNNIHDFERAMDKFATYRPEGVGFDDWLQWELNQLTVLEYIDLDRDEIDDTTSFGVVTSFYSEDDCNLACAFQFPYILHTISVED